MFKKLFPIIIASAIFLTAFALLRPAPSRMVAVAARDLKAGHVLGEQDIELQSIPAEILAEDVVSDESLVLGQPLRIDRGKGDVVRLSQLGNLVKLEANERAISVRITDANGVSGLLTPGQLVGVIATIPHSSSNTEVSGTFSKATIEKLRVLYIDPRFAASQDANVVPAEATPVGISGMSGLNTDERAREGSVILAVPTDLQTIFYDFSATGAISESCSVNALELLAALSYTDGASVTLYLMPQENPSEFSSPGLWLPDLIRTPFPTATPTPLGTPSPTTQTPAVTATIVP
ncbi:MAG: Flp pilus assembly protein CpaB [Anaerolineales bacterium]|nr:Flp pilus assembly protein CpaB [Anaerolineales bacterium]